MSINIWNGYGSCFKFTGSALLFQLVFFGNCFATTQFSTGLGIDEIWQKTEEQNIESTQLVTRISPAINFNYAGPSSSALLNYSYQYSVVDREDRKTTHSQKLNLSTRLEHLPGIWNSTFNAGIRQRFIRLDGNLILDDAVVTDNRDEFRSAVAASHYRNNTSFADYSADISFGTAGFKGQQYVDTIGFKLQLQDRGLRKAGWQLNLSSDVAESDDERTQIDRIELETRYQINRKLAATLQLEKYFTDEGGFNEVSTQLGLKWKPDPRSLMQIGVGKRGNDATYSLQALRSYRSLNLSLKYQETVDNPAAVTITENIVTNPDSTIAQLSLTPVLTRLGAIKLTINGHKNTLAFDYTNRSRSTQVDSEPNEHYRFLALRYRRIISEKTNFLIALKRQENQLNTDTTLNSISATASRKLGKRSSATMAVEANRQTFSGSLLDTTLQQLKLTYKLIF